MSLVEVMSGDVNALLQCGKDGSWHCALELAARQRPWPNGPVRRSRGTSGGAKRSLLGRILGWIVKLVLAFLVISVLWVLAYRFVNPPITVTMIGDVVAGRGAHKDWMPIEPDRPRHGPRVDRRRGQQVLLA